MSADCKEFCDFISRRMEHLDEAILEQMMPSPGRVVPTWWERRETVRRLSEGLAFRPSKKVTEIIEDGWIGTVTLGKWKEPKPGTLFDRFEKVFPDMNQDWPYDQADHSWAKLPC